MDPKSLSILIGGNANITCRLTKPNSSEIWFWEEKTKHSIKQPSDQIQVRAIKNIIRIHLIFVAKNLIQYLSICVLVLSDIILYVFT